MDVAQQRSRRITAVIVGMVMLVGTTACSNPLRDLQDRVIESGVEKLIESGTGIDSLDVFSAEVPANFPGEVPLPDAELAASFHVTEDGVTGWALHYNAEDAVTFDRYVAELTARGFSETETGGMGEGIKIGLFEDERYVISVMHMNDGSSGLLQVTVTERQP